MKKLVFFSLLLVAALLACEKADNSKGYVSVGSIEKTGDSNFDFIVNLDNGKILTPIDVYDNNTVSDGDRVIVEYTVIEEKENDHYEVDIYDIDDILTKGIIQLTEQIKDSIGDDPIYTNDDNIWISNKHLNIVFDYYGYNETHLINLVKPIGDPIYDDEDHLILEFKHNSKNDYPYNLLSGIVSFELESLRIADEESIDFVVRFNRYNDDYEFSGTYNFESSSAATAQKSDKIKLLKHYNSKNE